MIRTATRPGVLSAIGRARSVLLSAYVLPSGQLLDALEAAARRGARVTVRVEARPDAGGGAAARTQLARLNERSVQDLRAAGADAREVDRAGKDGRAMHLKAAVCDGVAYLDDRNWPAGGADTILRDDRRADVAALRSALLHGTASGSKSFCTGKAQAIRAETRLLAGAERAREVDVESESFGYGETYAALKALASEGVQCRLLVQKRRLGAQGLAAIEHLRGDGVDVRVGNCSEKMALADASRAWIGSANATHPDSGQLDWGLRTRALGVVRELQAHFDAAWSASKPP